MTAFSSGLMSCPGSSQGHIPSTWLGNIQVTSMSNVDTLCSSKALEYLCIPLMNTQTYMYICCEQSSTPHPKLSRSFKAKVRHKTVPTLMYGYVLYTELALASRGGRKHLSDVCIGETSDKNAKGIAPTERLELSTLRSQCIVKVSRASQLCHAGWNGDHVMRIN